MEVVDMSGLMMMNNVRIVLIVVIQADGVIHVGRGGTPKVDESLQVAQHAMILLPGLGENELRVLLLHAFLDVDLAVNVTHLVDHTGGEQTNNQILVVVDDEGRVVHLLLLCSLLLLLASVLTEFLVLRVVQTLERRLC